MQISTVAIIGGLGKTGGRVATPLRDRGIDIRAASRSSTPSFDWQDRGTWHVALTGVTAAYVAFQPDLAVAWAAEAISAFAKTAADAGVGHIVLLSGRGEDGAVRSENELKAVGVDYTVLRASWFNQNFSEGAFLDGLRQGKLALPVGDVPEPFVDADDLADVAVEVLTNPRHRNQTYELTGPRALTFREAVSEITAASGRAMEYETVPVDAFITELTVGGCRQRRSIFCMRFSRRFWMAAIRTSWMAFDRSSGGSPRIFPTMHAKPPQQASGASSHDLPDHKYRPHRRRTRQ